MVLGFFGGCFIVICGIVITIRGIRLLLRLLNFGFDIAEEKMDRIRDRS